MQKTVLVCTTDRSAEASLEWDNGPPWRVTLSIPGLEPAEAFGNDLFECLLSVREQVVNAGWKVCVVGARVDAWPSRMSSQMGGASLVYVHSMGLQALEKDLHPIFDDAPCDAIGSVEEQRQFRAQWFESLQNAP